MYTEIRPAAFTTVSFFSSVITETRSTALFTRLFYPSMLTNARSTTFLTAGLLLPLMLHPPQSIHLDFCFPCIQMPDPPPSLDSMMLTNARSSAFYTLAFYPSVITYPSASTVLTDASFAAMLTFSNSLEKLVENTFESLA
jgi:hypothetical protein